MICSDPELARIDYELSLLYAQAKLATHNSPSFRKINNDEWLRREKECTDKKCLLQWYANRHNQLVAVLEQHISTSSSSSMATSDSHASSTATADTTVEPSHQTSAARAETLSQQMITLPLIQKPLFWIIAIGAVILVSLAWELFGTDKETRKRMRLMATAVNSNIGEFLEQHSQTAHSGETHDVKKWDREKRQFIDEMVKPALTDCTPLSTSETDRLCMIIDYVAWGIKNNNTQYKFRGNLDDTRHDDYLQFCARILKHHAWKVRIVRASKPDGHILAVRKTHLIAVVCKLQSVPIGSEALREARVLQEEHKARKAVVIGNAPFTTSVEREAERADALLVHHFSLSLLGPMVEL